MAMLAVSETVSQMQCKQAFTLTAVLPCWLLEDCRNNVVSASHTSLRCAVDMFWPQAEAQLQQMHSLHLLSNSFTG